MPLILTACLIVAIADGDTLTALCNDHQQVKVRLAEIDAPEKSQPFGQRSKQSLAEMCFNAKAEIQVQATDRYKRTVGRVTCNGVDANAEQVKRGMAWVYDQYVKERSLYSLQDSARQAGVGLWSGTGADAPVKPWEWRRQH